jgi:myo-inositol-1(or 4)-monophosphatase
MAKGHLDFVTDVDRAVEEMISARISRLFPEDGIIGEEGHNLSSKSGHTWIIDPIDGTHNVVRGGSSCGVSIGLASDRPIGAALNAPVEGTLLVAESGKGCLAQWGKASHARQIYRAQHCAYRRFDLDVD